MNKNVWLRLLCLVLAMVMVGLTLIACSEPEEQEEKDPTSETPDETPDEDKEFDPYDIPDSLPEADYNQDEFNILYYNDNQLPFFYVPDKTGDLIDDSVWAARAAVQDRFNVTIVADKSGAESEGAHITLINNQMTAGVTEFDIANVHDVQGGNLSMQDVLVNILDVPQFDFE